MTNISSDGTQKRVHTEISDLSSSNDESMKSEKKIKVTSSNWPKVLIISSTEDGALTKLSSFAVQKAIVGFAGEPKSVKRIKIRLLVECTSQRHSSCLLKSKTFCSIPVKVTSRWIFSTGVIKCRDLEGICQNVSSQNVIAVRWICYQRISLFSHLTFQPSGCSEGRVS